MININIKNIKKKSKNIAKKVGTTVINKALSVKKWIGTKISKEKIQKLEISLNKILIEKPKEITKKFVYNRIDLKGINEYYEEKVSKEVPTKDDSTS